MLRNDGPPEPFGRLQCVAVAFAILGGVWVLLRFDMLRFLR